MIDTSWYSGGCSISLVYFSKFQKQYRRFDVAGLQIRHKSRCARWFMDIVPGYFHAQCAAYA